MRKLNADSTCAHAISVLGLSTIYALHADQYLQAASVCRQDKSRENAIALEVLPDLLTELDALEPEARCGLRLM